MSNNPIFSFTRRDYEGLRVEGLSKIPIRSKGIWTDLNATDPGIILLDYVHALVDMIQFYQDHQALEAFISTAKERENLFRLAKQLSYKVRSSKGSLATVKFTSKSAYSYAIKIPRYTKLTSKNNIPYLTIEDTYLAPNTTMVDVKCMQGEVRSTVYHGTAITRYSDVENAVNQSITLTDKNIDTTTIEIKDNNNQVWNQLEYIIFSDSNTKAYEVVLNHDDTVTINFGDGERGIAPSIADTLIISYVVNLASEGRVGVGDLSKLSSPIYDKRGNIVEFTLYNINISSGGIESESSSEIRYRAPGIIKSQDRAVTINDYKYLAESIDGVSHAVVYDINNAPDLCLHHEVKVIIVPDNIVSDEETLIQVVYNYLYQRMIPPTNLQAIVPAKIPINIHVRVKVMSNLPEGGIDYSIRESLYKFFNNRKSNIGESIYPSEISSVITNVAGVRYIISMTPTDVVHMSSLSIATLGDVIIEIE